MKHVKTLNTRKLQNTVKKGEAGGGFGSAGGDASVKGFDQLAELLGSLGRDLGQRDHFGHGKDRLSGDVQGEGR